MWIGGEFLLESLFPKLLVTLCPCVTTERQFPSKYFKTTPRINFHAELQGLFTGRDFEIIAEQPSKCAPENIFIWTAVGEEKAYEYLPIWQFYLFFLQVHQHLE